MPNGQVKACKEAVLKVAGAPDVPPVTLGVYCCTQLSRRMHQYLPLSMPFDIHVRMIRVK